MPTKLILIMNQKMKNHENNEEKENDIDTNIIKLREELEQKSKQIKNLQNKLDSQDIIITDYYKLKDGIKDIDNKAFFVVSSSYEVGGGKWLTILKRMVVVS